MVRVSARVQELKRICWLIVAGLLTACSPAPQFTDSQNQPVALADFAGKPLLVNYFAPLVCPLPAGDTAAGGAGAGGRDRRGDGQL